MAVMASVFVNTSYFNTWYVSARAALNVIGGAVVAGNYYSNWSLGEFQQRVG